MITLTESALKEVKHIQENSAENVTKGLRVELLSGGCAGFMYQLSFSDPDPINDTIFEQGGVKVITNTNYLKYLDGTIIDYESGLDGTGFVFGNPNAQATCGCNKSFSA